MSRSGSTANLPYLERRSTVKVPENAGGGPGTPPRQTAEPDHHEADQLPRQDSARDRRIRVFKANAATWEHFRHLGLTSDVVADTLQQLLREAA